MADTDIQIADAAQVARKVDTRTVGVDGDEHRQVMVLGDPSAVDEVAPVTSAFGLLVDVARAPAADPAPALGTPADAAWTSGDGTLIGLLKAIWARLRGGPQVGADSLPVVLATDQAALSVTVDNWPDAGPVSGTVDVGNFPATQPISGTVAVSNYPATQPVSGSVAVSNFPGTQPVSGTVTANAGTGPFPVSDNGGSLTVDGSVSVSNFPATQPVSGSVAVTNLPATQPVSGTVAVSGTVPVSDAGGSLTVDGAVSVSNLPATQAVSGTVAVSNLPATQPVSGTVTATVSNFPATQPVSGTFWQATQPVSGTVTANAGTGTQAVSAAALPLPAGAATAAKQPALGTAGAASTDVLSVQGIASGTALPVSGSVAVSNFPASQAVTQAVPTETTGNITAQQTTAQTPVAGGTVVAAVAGAGTMLIAAHGTYTTSTIIFEGTDSSGFWLTLQGYRLPVGGAAGIVESSTFSALANTSYLWQVPCAGLTSVRVRCSFYGGGTIAVTLTPSNAPAHQFFAIDTGGFQRVTPYLDQGANFIASASSVGVAAPNAVYIQAVGGYVYNGTSWDAPRNNTNATLLASAARTVTTTTPTQTNFNGCGVIFYLNITAASGTGGLYVMLYGVDPVSANLQALHAAPASRVTGTGCYVYVYYPGASTQPAVGFAASVMCPRTFVAQVSVGDASSYTYSLGMALCL